MFEHPRRSAYGGRVIASLRGTVVRRTASACVVDVAGVGYLVNLTPRHALELREGHEAMFVTHLAVREDAFTLFGFHATDELDVFELLIGVSGVGPKSALGVLSQLTPDEVARAVAEEDVKVFKRAPGIGPKTAQLIIVSLKGKLVPTGRAGTASADAAALGAGADGTPSLFDRAGVTPAQRADVIEALVGLGYVEKQVAPVVDDAIVSLMGDEANGESGAVPDVAAILRAALRLLGPGRAGGVR